MIMCYAILRRNCIHAIFQLIALCLLSLVSGCVSAVRYSSDSAYRHQVGETTPENKSKTKGNNQKHLLPFPQSDAPLTPMQQNLVEKARQFLGTSYCYGGNGPQCLDCSGFMAQIFGSCGVILPRTAQQQSFVGHSVTPNEVSAGDLFFFSFDNRTIDHVGMYMGSGSIIHASKSKGVVLQRLDLPGMLSGLRSIRRVIGVM